MMRRLLGILVLATLANVASISAETIAVAIRSHADDAAAPELADIVEQGTMEYLFGAGHIVFDLNDDPADETYAYHAATQAVEGGAHYLVIVDLTFATTDTKGLAPTSAVVTLFDARTQDELSEDTLVASSLDGFAEMTADTIADRLGGLAAARAIAGMGGGSQAW